MDSRDQPLAREGDVALATRRWVAEQHGAREQRGLQVLASARTRAAARTRSGSGGLVSCVRQQSSGS
uniref:Uncharacterized protein n=1 Tax=Arundo donax TaxID=35708 RepID=A0A0A9DN08_ARUDO